MSSNFITVPQGAYAQRSAEAPKAPPTPFKEGTRVVTSIMGSDPRIWSKENAAKREHGLRGTIVHVARDGVVVRTDEGHESCYQMHELRLCMEASLYAVMLEKYNRRNRRYEPADFAYCKALSSYGAKMIIAKDLRPGEKIVSAAPVIGAFAQDEHAEELVL